MFCPRTTSPTIFYRGNQSEDKIVNLNGRKLLDFGRQNELRIYNGRLGDDRNIGKFTFRASSGRSVVDYVITNITMFEAIQSFKICDPNIFSDHCVLEISILKNENIYTARREKRALANACIKNMPGMI